MNAKQRVTSFDVAAAAGVSRTTVSFVLNNTPRQSIPESTRRAVLHAAQTLGYTPSAAAKTLRAGTSRLVLCLAPDWEPSALMDEGLTRLTRNLRDAGYATVVAKANERADSLDILWQTISPAAVVAMFNLADTDKARIAALRVPLVEAFFHSGGTRSYTENFQITAGRLQGDYVVNAGATQLVYVSPHTARDADIYADRLLGVRDAAQTRNLPAPRVIELDELHAISEIEILKITDGHGIGRLAICCYNDLIALQVVHAALRLGLEVPRDLAVIGVDDEPMSSLVSPALTSVRFNIPAHMDSVSSRILTALGNEKQVLSDDSSICHVVPRESA